MGNVLTVLRTSHSVNTAVPERLKQLDIKVLLTIPPSSLKENYGNLADAAPNLPLLGVSYIAKSLKGKVSEVKVLNLTKYGYEAGKAELLRHIRTLGFRAVGFPVYITTKNIILKLAAEIKVQSPVITFVGGPEPTINPTGYRSNAIDFGIIGEGEHSVMPLLDFFFNKHEISENINGIFFWRGDEWIIHPKKEVNGNLEEYGNPDLEQYDLDAYEPAIHVLGSSFRHTLASRGCTFRCSFCAAAETFGRTIRFRSTKSVIDELEGYTKQGADSFIFYDDTFTLNKKNALAIAEGISVLSKKAQKKLYWTCFTRTDCVDDTDLLQKMRQSGCYLITFGCESANDKTLELMNKGLTVEQNLSGIRKVNAAGIMTASTFMMGLPGETKEDIERTIRFAIDSGLTFAYFPVFEPYEGTPIYEVCKREGKWIKNSGYKNAILVNQEDVWEPNTISRKEIERLAKLAFRKFYIRPKVLYHIFTKDVLKMPLPRQWRFVKSGFKYLTARTTSSNKGARF